MAGFFDEESNRQLENLLRAAASTDYTTLYVVLLTSAPNKTMDGSDVAAIETAYTNYARVVVTMTAGVDFDAVVAGATENTNAITFPTCGASGATITHWALLNGVAGDDNDECIMFGTLTASKVISTGDTPEFAAGEMDITLS